MTTSSFRAAAILLAGGSGSRMSGSLPDKILHPIAGKPVWRHSYDAFIESDCIRNWVFVFRDEEQRERIQSELPKASLENIAFAQGGAERQDSVWAGLKALPKETEVTLIHDCARPLVSPAAIRKVASAAAIHGAASLAKRVADTVKQSRPAPESVDTCQIRNISRANLWATETPQAFRFHLIRDAYETIIETGTPITDDLSAIEPDDHPVRFIENDRPNLKLTTPQDIDYIEFLLGAAKP